MHFTIHFFSHAWLILLNWPFYCDPFWHFFTVFIVFKTLPLLGAPKSSPNTKKCHVIAAHFDACYERHGDDRQKDRAANIIFTICSEITKLSSYTHILNKLLSQYFKYIYLSNIYIYCRRKTLGIFGALIVLKWNEFFTFAPNLFNILSTSLGKK